MITNIANAHPATSGPARSRLMGRRLITALQNMNEPAATTPRWDMKSVAIEKYTISVITNNEHPGSNMTSVKAATVAMRKPRLMATCSKAI